MSTGWMRMQRDNHSSFIADEIITKTIISLKEKDFFTIVPHKTLAVELSRIITLLLTS
jgi:hypothetical protein